jgi:hypothetical protein
MNTILLCTRIEDISKGDSAIPGSTIQKCCKCSKDVYVSPASMNAVLDMKKAFDFVCTRCLDPEEIYSTVPFSPEQIKEVRDNL